MDKHHYTGLPSHARTVSHAETASRIDCGSYTAGSWIQTVESSSFERMAAGVNGMSQGRLKHLGLLLNTTISYQDRTPHHDRALWANEAMERAHDFIRLFRRLERYAPEPGESDAAKTVAAAFAELDTNPEEGILLCSGVLRNLVRGYVELFGPAATDVRLCTNIERLTLPAIKRRALVLLASKLVVEGLLRAPSGHINARLNILLERASAAEAHLIVSQSTRSGALASARTPNDLVLDLAIILQGRVTTFIVDKNFVTAVSFPFTAAST